MAYSDRLREFVSIEEKFVSAQLDAARAAVDHAGEKGRALEGHVSRLIRSFLPAEYGLSTGFVAAKKAKGVQLSKQLDIIIFDALRCAPLLSMGSCEVFPLEAVYGYVEVKAQLTSSGNLGKTADSSIERCLQDNRKLRKSVNRHYWRPDSGSPSIVELVAARSLGLRSYVFAFEWAGSMDKLAQRVSTVSMELGPPTHIHGVYVANKGFLYTEPVDSRKAVPLDYYHTRSAEEDGLLVFKSALFQALATFPRPEPNWVPAIDQYYEARPDWRAFTPEVARLWQIDP